jgi:methionine synthase II (cobalamin-independent)
MSARIKSFSTTGIGSFPHLNAADACELVLRTFDIPFWPQLPNTSFRESMIAQYSEGMPYIKVDDSKGSIVIMRDESDQLERFYESCSDTSRISISEDYAMGLHAFLKMIKGRRFPMLKGQVTGPVTFTLGLKDHNGSLVYFDEELREISSMLLKAKVRWQIDALKQHAEEVIIFIDEPILSALGSSSYLGVDAAEAFRLIKDMVSAIRDAGAISAVHCCGRADWPMVIETGAQIINFDAFDYFDTLVIYHEHLEKFLSSGGYIAWGMVPTTDAIETVDERQLTGRMCAHFEELNKYMPADLVQKNILITPSCGTASRSIEETTKICQLLMRLKEALA